MDLSIHEAGEQPSTIGVGIITNHIPCGSLCNYTRITPKPYSNCFRPPYYGEMGGGGGSETRGAVLGSLFKGILPILPIKPS